MKVAKLFVGLCLAIAGCTGTRIATDSRGDILNCPSSIGALSRLAIDTEKEAMRYYAIVMNHADDDRLNSYNFQVSKEGHVWKVYAEHIIFAVNGRLSGSGGVEISFRDCDGKIIDVDYAN